MRIKDYLKFKVYHYWTSPVNMQCNYLITMNHSSPCYWALGRMCEEPTRWHLWHPHWRPLYKNNTSVFTGRHAVLQHGLRIAQTDLDIQGSHVPTIHTCDHHALEPRMEEFVEKPFTHNNVKRWCMNEYWFSLLLEAAMLEEAYDITWNSRIRQFPTIQVLVLMNGFNSLLVVLVGELSWWGIVLGLWSRWAMVGLYFYPVGIVLGGELSKYRKRSIGKSCML